MGNEMELGSVDTGPWQNGLRSFVTYHAGSEPSSTARPICSCLHLVTPTMSFHPPFLGVAYLYYSFIPQHSNLFLHCYIFVLYIVLLPYNSKNDMLVMNSIGVLGFFVVVFLKGPSHSRHSMYESDIFESIRTFFRVHVDGTAGFFFKELF